MDAGTKAFVRAREVIVANTAASGKNTLSYITTSNTLSRGSTRGTTALTISPFRVRRCNAFKGPNLSGIDPDTRTLVPLFDPRRQEWTEHFEFRSVWLVGLTPIGRATVSVLAMNETRRLELRALLLAEGELP